MANLRVDRDRLWATLMDMARIGATAKGGSCRLALTDDDKAARDLFVRWCSEAGCRIAVDDLGNIFATRAGRNASLPPIATGSHLDTQPHGGKFDGVYGVLAGLEVVRTLNDHDVSTERPIEVVVWTNEEGVRFAPGVMGSGVFAGTIDRDHALSQRDARGCSVGAELARIGYAGPEACGARTFGAFLEAHIEQGPILEMSGHPIGIVTGAQGLAWYDVCVVGEDAHAGTTPMTARRDALSAAAEMTVALEELAHAHAPHAVATVGGLEVSPNSRNTIPGHVRLAVDVRHPDATVLGALGEAFERRCAEIAGRKRLAVNVERVEYVPPVAFDADCVDTVRGAARRLEHGYQDIMSGAGHDACQLARRVPTGMIFVPCAGGLSHNEAESAQPQDLAAGCDVLLHAIVERARGQHR